MISSRFVKCSFWISNLFLHSLNLYLIYFINLANCFPCISQRAADRPQRRAPEPAARPDSDRQSATRPRDTREAVAADQLRPRDRSSDRRSEASHSGFGGAISDYEDDDFIVDPLPEEETESAPPSFRDLLDAALSTKDSADGLTRMVEKARKPSQVQIQAAFGRLYKSDRVVELNVLPPRPNPEEAEALSTPNRGAVRDLQEACRHNATLVQGAFALSEALVHGAKREVLSQICADMLTYGFGAHAELVTRIKEIVRSSISSRFAPVDEFRFPDNYRPLSVLTEEERAAARKERTRIAKTKLPPSGARSAGGASRGRTPSTLGGKRTGAPFSGRPSKQPREDFSRAGERSQPDA